MNVDIPERHLQDRFLTWQCRLRQHAMRTQGGRPPPGAMPRATTIVGDEIAPAITTVLVERAPAESIAAFRHVVRKTHDPASRLEEALRLLSSSYYERPERFSDIVTALFADDSTTVDALLADPRCVLDFEQFGQGYRLPCGIEALLPTAAAFQATYWHNHMFNAAMPGAVRVLAFTPDWRGATADPAV